MIFWKEENVQISYDELLYEIKQKKTKYSLPGYKYFFNILLKLLSECKFESFSDIVKYISKNADELSFIISTSGTTSKPKDVEVNMLNCIRHVKKNGSNKKNGNGHDGKSVKIYGPLCMQIDSINDSVHLSSTNVGDIIVFSNVGAYNLTQSMQFIQTRPAVILLGPHGSEVIRKKETWRDIFSLDSVPDRLSSKSNGKH